MSNVTESDLKTAVELSSLAADLVAERKRLTEAARRIAELEAERDGIRDKALEEAAALHESISPASDDERLHSAPGAGAMGAIIEYRDAIRALKGTKP